ncbi:iron ABC transporter permease, partial [Alphaproteobacteria bacterium]|nr:iron ABC transporter permease [Alphaproteobacteria bacterium]
MISALTGHYHRNPTVMLWLMVGLFSSILLPWYGIEDGFFDLEWIIDGYPFDSDFAPLFFLLGQGEKLWLTPLIMPFFFAFFALTLPQRSSAFSWALIIGGGLGLIWMCGQGLSIGIRGWQIASLQELFGPLDDRQFGMGYGAILYFASCLFLFSTGLAEQRGTMGDKFIIGMICFVVMLVGIFVFYPIIKLIILAFIDEQNAYSLSLFWEKISDSRIWSLGCVFAERRCGVAWNTVFMATIVGFLTTTLGLVFALLVTRT